MYSFPIHCRDARIASQTRSVPAATPIGTACIKGARRLDRRFEPLQGTSLHSIEDLLLADMIARAVNDNASQLYRGV